MSYGYWGKILEINLTTKTYKDIEIEESLYRKYLGGSGLAAALLYKSFGYNKPALSEENPLMFMPGLYLEHQRHLRLNSCSRKSPLTNIWGESIVGVASDRNQKNRL